MKYQEHIINLLIDDLKQKQNKKYKRNKKRKHRAEKRVQEFKSFMKRLINEDKKHTPPT